MTGVRISNMTGVVIERPEGFGIIRIKGDDGIIYATHTHILYSKVRLGDKVIFDVADKELPFDGANQWALRTRRSDLERCPQLEREMNNLKRKEESRRKAELLKAESDRLKARTKYFIEYQIGDVWKPIYPNGAWFYLDTLEQAKEYRRKIKTAHPKFRFRIKKCVV